MPCDGHSLMGNLFSPGSNSEGVLSEKSLILVTAPREVSSVDHEMIIPFRLIPRFIILTNAIPSNEALILFLSTTANVTSKMVSTAITRSKASVSHLWMQFKRYDGFCALSSRARFL